MKTIFCKTSDNITFLRDPQTGERITQRANDIKESNWLAAQIVAGTVLKVTKRKVAKPAEDETETGSGTPPPPAV